MKKEDLFEFVKQFNKVKAVPNATILEGLKTLPAEDHQLFMLLVNYKNGCEFAKNLPISDK